MPQSRARVLVHLAFSTKNREPYIAAENRPQLFAYLGGTLNALDCPCLIVSGMPDHIHQLFVLARTLALSKVVEELKKESAKWAKPRIHPHFYWQNGYGAFSVSLSNAAQVHAYIANQEAHHRSMTFQDEYREFLRRHEIEWDERSVWD